MIILHLISIALTEKASHTVLCIPVLDKGRTLLAPGGIGDTHVTPETPNARNLNVLPSQHSMSGRTINQLLLDNDWNAFPMDHTKNPIVNIGNIMRAKMVQSHNVGSVGSSTHLNVHCVNFVEGLNFVVL